MSNAIRRAAVLALVLSALAGCGGGGGGGGSTSGGGGGTGSSGSAADPAGPSASFAQQCAAGNTLAPVGQRSSTLATEQKWLRAYIDEAYLWRDEVPRVEPSGASFNLTNTYAALSNYFDALLSPQRTDSGALRDRFSFTYPTAEWTSLIDDGLETGYGIEWVQASTQPPRQIRVAFVEPASPAGQQGLLRGDLLVSVDGLSADTAGTTGVSQLNAALYPGSVAASHSFVFQRSDGRLVTANMTSAAIARTAVPLARTVTTPAGTRAGYLLFNDHSAPSESQLITAMQGFQAQGLRELVLDLRYNGGGYLYVASELATMIAGTTRTSGRAFDSLRYNARRSSENEVTPFRSESCNLVANRCTQSQPLPQLNLTRVYVLAQAGTCSASESVINGLRGVGVNVVLVGGKTCGKPYGFTAKDNCGISYFPIEFMGVNAQGFGDYADGFEPTTGADTGTRFVNGCSVPDDFGHALGDATEALLASALGHIDTGRCPALAGATAGARAQSASSGEGGAAPLLLQRHPARSNLLLLPR